MHVVIVGAGIIGLATAFELRRRGVQITILDPAPASQATHAAAGMLAAAAEAVWGQDPLHQMMAQSAAMYPEFMDTVEHLTGQRPDYLRNGTLLVAAEPADRAALDELNELRQTLGHRTERLLGSQARRHEPALAANISAAVLLPDDHQIDPRSLARILLEYLAEDMIHEAVSELVQRNGKVCAVRTTSGQLIEADQVLVASGLGTVPGMPNLPLRPVYGDILRLEVPEHARPLLRHTVRGIVHRRQVYLVPRTDGSIVLGASSREDGRELVGIEALYTLLDDARRLVPGIMDASLREVIARARPATPDDRPIIDRVDNALVISTGYFRHGVLLTPLAARLGADLLLGLPPNPEAAALTGLARFTTTDAMN